jgi:hypothetical protein
LLSMFGYDVVKLKKFLEENKQPITVFDLNFSNRNDPMYEMNMTRVMLSEIRGFQIDSDLKKNFVELLAEFFEQRPKLNRLWKKHESFLQALTSKLANLWTKTAKYALFSKPINIWGCMEGEAEYNAVMAQNHHDLKQEMIAGAFYPFKHILGNSCDPNTLMQSVFDKNVVIVCKPIKEGEEISRAMFRGFDSSGPAWYRKNSLKSAFGISCDCEACKKNWPLREQLPAVDPKFNYPEFKTFASHEQAKANVARNNTYVDRNLKKQKKPTKEVYFTIYNNQFELETLSRPPFYP